MIRKVKYAFALTAALTAVSAPAQTWKQLVNRPPINAYNPTLLMDGTVLVQDGDNSNWWRLYPDKNGSYINGSWKQMKSTPSWGPLYYASAVLKDGRFFAMGGEYDFGNLIWNNKGFIFDPDANTWTQINPPSNWSQIGDMGSVMLADGTVLLAHPLSSELALFDPVTNIITAPYSTGKADGNDEEGLTLLPNGKVLCVNVGVSQGSEIFDPVTKKWSSAGTIPQQLVGDGSELGPQVLRYDGTVICFGGSVHNCVYDSKTGKWSNAPDFPAIGGALDCADAPACLLPNGNVLVMTSPGLFLNGSVFFEVDTKNVFKRVPGPPRAAGDTSFVGNFLTLPTGEILFTDQSSDIEVYQPTGKADPSLAPHITTSPTLIKAGQSYKLTGTQFNGLSGCSAYGDDQQNATNYPIVKITNKTTGHVFYCRASEPSTMGICTGSNLVSVNFVVPSGVEPGPSWLQVVTNGIPSQQVAVSTQPTAQASAITLLTGTSPVGNVKGVWTVADGLTYSALSKKISAGQVVDVEADFTLPSSSVTSLGVTTWATAKSGATAFTYLYDWTKKAYVLYTQKNSFGSGQMQYTTVGDGNLARFVGPGNVVKFVIRSVVPGSSAASYRLNIDAIQIIAQ